MLSSQIPDELKLVAHPVGAAARRRALGCLALAGSREPAS